MPKKYKPNPKQEGSNLLDCTPQEGPCPMSCNQCYYNKDESLWKVNVPTKKDAKGKIVRINALHDSNIKRYLVLRTAKRYEHFFFNTSILKFVELPGPIVYTANSNEEQPVDMRFIGGPDSNKLMFARLRVSATNLHHVEKAVGIMHDYCDIPIVMTFMAYYDRDIETRCSFDDGKTSMQCYVWKVRHVNTYWCPTRGFKRYVLNRMRNIAGRQVTICGTLDSNYCKDCRNCESYYWQTSRRLMETVDGKS